MDKIIEFISLFISREVEAINNSRLPDLERYNASFELMDGMLFDQMRGGFGLVRMHALKEQKHYDRWAMEGEFTSRYLYKIERYIHEKFGDLYLAYCSLDAPNIDALSTILFVAKFGNEFKIFNASNWTSYLRDQHEWDSTFTFNENKDGFVEMRTLGEPLEIIKFRSPEKIGVELYNRDGIDPKDVGEKSTR